MSISGLQAEVQTFLDEIEKEKSVFQIMSFNMTAGHGSWAASLLYVQIKGQENGNT